MITRVRRLSGKSVRHGWLWAVSAILSLAFVLATVGSWASAWSDRNLLAGIGTTVTKPAEVDQMIARDVGPWTLYRIPTGVDIQSFEFSGTNNVTMSGLVWQKISKDLPAEVKRGVLFPEADQSPTAAPDYTFTLGHTELIGWRFRAKLRQRFEYNKYPLDRQDVWLRMRSADFVHPVQLVPDFATYPQWKLDNLSGLRPELVNGAWHPYYTAFSMKRIDYGIKGVPAIQGAEMYFNIGVSRGLVGPLVGRLIPVLLLAGLLFLTLYVTTMDLDRRVLSGFTAFAIIGFAVSTTLCVATYDNGVRNETGVAGLMYIEFWYFCLYFMTLLVVLNAACLVSNKFGRALTWRENLLPRLAFWPIFTGIMFLSAFAYLGI